MSASGRDDFGRSGQVTETFTLVVHNGKAVAEGSSISVHETTNLPGCTQDGTASGSRKKEPTTAFANYTRSQGGDISIGIGGIDLIAIEHDSSDCGSQGHSTSTRTRYEKLGLTLDLSQAGKSGTQHHVGNKWSGTYKSKGCSLPGPPSGQIWPDGMKCKQVVTYGFSLRVVKK